MIYKFNFELFFIERMSLKLIIFDIEAFKKENGELKPVAIGYCICEPDFLN